jgi:hypothetical protein
MRLVRWDATLGGEPSLSPEHLATPSAQPTLDFRAGTAALTHVRLRT